MKTIVIDCAYMTERKAAHEYLQRVLSLPEHYGHNLDALYDCLTEMQPIRLVIYRREELKKLGGYGSTLLDTLRRRRIGKYRCGIHSGRKLR